MDNDINTHLPSINEVPAVIEIQPLRSQQDSKEENVPYLNNPTLPRSELDWKVCDVGLSCLNPVKPLPMNPKKRSFSLYLSSLSKINAEAFARYVKKEALHIQQLNELNYMEERIKEDREIQAELLSEEKKTTEIGPLHIQNYNPA